MVINSTSAIEVSIQAVSPELILSLVTVKGAVGAGAAAAAAAGAAALASAAAGAAAVAAGAAAGVASSARAGEECSGPSASSRQAKAPATTRLSDQRILFNTSMRICATPSFSFM